MNSPLVYHPAHQLVQQIHQGNISVVDTVNAFSKQVGQYNGRVNAIFDQRSKEDLLREAKEKDELLARGKVGALHGVPLTIKDNFWVKGLKVSNGHPGYRNFIAPENTELVKRLKQAGAIILGKTNVPLFSIDWQATNWWNGTTNNPYDLSRVPGGSSGGAAASGAAGFSPLELGGDQGGSIRVPAHFCGICGLRPTEGALSNQGHIRFPGKPQGHRHVTVADPLARNVEDLILMMNVLWGQPTTPSIDQLPISFNDTSYQGGSLRIAVAESLHDVSLDEEYLSIFRKFIEKIKKKSHTVTYDHPQYDEKEAYLVCGKITGYELDINLPPLPLAKLFMYAFIRFKYRDQLWAKGIKQGISMSARKYAQALQDKDALANVYHSFLGKYNVWITPVAATEAFVHQRAGKPFLINNRKVGYTKAIATYNFTTALSGHPIAVIPIGYKRNGLPVGIQIHAQRWTDKRLLEIAQHLSADTPGFTIPSSMSNFRSAS